MNPQSAIRNPQSVTFTHRGRPYVVFLRKRDVNNPAAPYYFRVDGRPLSTKQHTADAAIREAKARLELRHQAPGDYAAALEQLKARASRTVGQLLDAWSKAGHPHPNGQPRTQPQRDRQDTVLKLALDWWRDQPAATVTGPTLNQFAQWRRGHSRTGDAGTRAVDMELTALSACFAWAVATGQAQTNPFLHRPRFHASTAVTHCSEHMPASDEQLHALIGALFRSSVGLAAPREPGPDQLIIAGAQLLFQALTGLRPGEPGFLRWDATWTNGRPQPGLRYRIEDHSSPASPPSYSELLAVHREKNGINPAVTVHPCLAAFLDSWAAYSRPRWSSAWYFPDPANPEQPLVTVQDTRKRLATALQTASQALGLPCPTPHSMRAFYVRVRRSQGIDDARIALELGQGSGPGLVVRTYGESHGIHGDRRFDWLPAAPQQPAWIHLPAGSAPVTLPLQATA